MSALNLDEQLMLKELIKNTATLTQQLQVLNNQIYQFAVKIQNIQNMPNHPGVAAIRNLASWFSGKV